MLLMVAIVRFGLIYGVTCFALEQHQESESTQSRLIAASLPMLVMGAVCMVAVWAMAKEHMTAVASSVYIELCILPCFLAFMLHLYAGTITHHAQCLCTASDELIVLKEVKLAHHQLLLLLRKVLPRRTVAHLLAQQQQQRDDKAKATEAKGSTLTEAEEEGLRARRMRGRQATLVAPQNANEGASPPINRNRRRFSTQPQTANSPNLETKRRRVLSRLPPFILVRSCFCVCFSDAWLSCVHRKRNRSDSPERANSR
jgi:hypothetical protein